MQIKIYLVEKHLYFANLEDSEHIDVYMFSKKMCFPDVFFTICIA